MERFSLALKAFAVRHPHSPQEDAFVCSLWDSYGMHSTETTEQPWIQASASDCQGELTSQMTFFEVTFKNLLESLNH